ncbi:ACP S-malonyltransferase [bacterium]|nr:ACP S-malonyltransferase [bacterium]
MGTAFLFPGQASQFVGMGADLYEQFDVARIMFDRADNDLPFDLKRLCFEGPIEELTQTRVTQPAIFVVSVITSILLGPKDMMAASAGHSLGEYSALVAAGALNFDEALKAVALRGELMQNAGNVRPGTMAAVIGMNEEQVNALCAEASTDDEVVVPANFNSPGQIVVSGDVEAVKRAVEHAKPMGARMAKLLNVSGAFHSPLMAPAAKELAAKLSETPIRPPSVPVYLNVTAKPTTNPDEIRERLIDQLTHPVLWEQTLRNMADGDELTHYLEVGPGNVLQGLVKRTLAGAAFSGAGNAEQVQAILDEGVH